MRVFDGGSNWWWTFAMKTLQHPNDFWKRLKSLKQIHKYAIQTFSQNDNFVYREYLSEICSQLKKEKKKLQ